VKRLATLLPPPRRHLLRFHGVFAPNARLRAVVTRLGRPAVEAPPSAPRTESLPFTSAPPVAQEPPPRPRVDWATLLRHSFGLDVLLCPCGGRRRLLAAVVSPAIADKVLRDLGRLPQRSPPATGPPTPQLALPL
jgi:hypothetical protein